MPDHVDEAEPPYFITDEHLAVIGRIANAWSAMEFTVDETSWRLAKVPAMIGACMTAQMLAMGAKMRALIALCELRGISEDTLKKLRQFNGNKIAPLQERRNRTVHDYRLRNNATGEAVRLQITAQGPLVFDFHPEPTKDLEETRRKIEAALREFILLRDALIAEFAALPDTAGRQLLDISPVVTGSRFDPS